MRDLSYYVATSLDGFIAREDGRFDCFPDGGHVQAYLDSLADFGAVVMGRRTYQVGLDMGVTNPYPHLKSYVFSRSLAESPDPAVTVVSGEPAPFVRELKQEEGKPIYLCGGGDLAGQLFAAGLVDEVVLKLNPLVLGQGIPFAAALPAPLRLSLVDTRPFDSGVVFLRYRVENPATGRRSSIAG